jgi:hypothetical protein
MGWEEFNAARKEAGEQFYYLARRIWQAIPKSYPAKRQLMEEVQRLFRISRAIVFDTKSYGCHYYAKKIWHREVSWKASWEDSLPSEYDRKWLADIPLWKGSK